MVRRNIPLFGLLVLGASAVPVQAQTTLRYQFKAGEKLKYELEQKISQKARIQGKEFAFSITQVIDLSWNVKEVDKEGQAKVAIRFERFRMKIDSPQGKLDYDSTSGKEPEGTLGTDMGPVLKAMKDLEFEMTMESTGKIANVRVPEKFAKAVTEAAGGRPGLEDLFSTEGLKKMMGQSALELPKDAVTKGKSWNQLVTNKTKVGNMRMDNVYVYDGTTTEAGQALEKITLKPVVSMDPEAKFSIKVKDQKSKGTALFDNAAGRLVEVRLEQTLILEAGQSSQEMQQTTLMKLKK